MSTNLIHLKVNNEISISLTSLFFYDILQIL